MTTEQPAMDALLVATAFQQHILPGVSRTFALTIPQLPEPLGGIVSNAYLLCRLADTIEDEPTLAPADKVRLTEAFADLVSGTGDVAAFVADLLPRLSAATSAHERELVENTQQVLNVTASYDDRSRQAIARCVRIMCRGMHRYQQQAGPAGLRDLDDLGRYCYYVAGVVGEMLSDLFSAHAPRTARREDDLRRYAVAFGQGLQMTNILKDLWEDRARGISWMPRATFAAHGIEVATLDPARDAAAFAQAIRELVAVTRAQLEYALEFTLAIDRADAGIRRFCAWNIGMALLTLRKIIDTPSYACANDVKISRRSVVWTMALTGVGIRSNTWLRFLFRRIARGLPQIAALPAQAPQDA